MKVVDVPRPEKKRRKLADPAQEPSTVTAYCPTCRIVTGMKSPHRRIRAGVSLTTGSCAECGHDTARVGAAGSDGESPA